MPFQSEAQRRFLWAKHPDIAKKWAHGKHSKEMPETARNAVRRRLKEKKDAS